MFEVTNLELSKTGAINQLVLDYLSDDEKLKKFYSYPPNKNGFSELLKTSLYPNFNRQLLTEIALKQSSLVNNTSQITIKKIESLKQDNVFTVTTGHQLCLFTGPLYFIYKIVSTINLSEELKKEFPDFDFVPVYWMATEDHDFEEINHFNLFGKNFKWQSNQTGAVGDFKTENLIEVLSLLKESISESEHANYLLSLFENAYIKHHNLKDATRFLVNELFGNYGLVVIDGNNIEFKKQFVDFFEKDFFNNSTYNDVKESTAKLTSLGYSSQVNPRELNCFYLNKNVRGRIEKTNSDFKLVGSDVIFTEEEIRYIIKNEPQKISPNVVLRPLYQQHILPNIAYVGGPGEIAYWLQFKKMFDTLNVNFPIIMPRNFITVIDNNTLKKINKLTLTPDDFFNDINELIKTYQLKNDNVFTLEKEKENIAELYHEISKKISNIDKTLEITVSAELQKTINSIDTLASKANKSLKKQSENEINQINNIKHKIYPNSIPQERFENFSGFYLKYGKHFISELKNHIGPFNINHKILIDCDQ
jgi:bacillithiol biosynthesis cysteine-adding enzyme BshC